MKVTYMLLDYDMVSLKMYIYIQLYVDAMTVDLSQGIQPITQLQSNLS